MNFGFPSHLSIPTVYARLKESNAKSVGVVFQCLQTNRTWKQGDEIITYSQRPREEEFLLGLTNLAIRYTVFQDPSNPSEAAQALEKGHHYDAWIVTAERCYQTVSIASSLLKVDRNITLLLEITEESTFGQNRLSLLEALRRHHVKHLIENLVFLRKTKGDPNTIDLPDDFLLAVAPTSTSENLTPTKAGRASSTKSQGTLTAFDVTVPATPQRRSSTVSRVIRDSDLAYRVKLCHNFMCQICGHTIVLPSGLRYAEAHHIRPLGTPHNGPDIAENILCLCPNHHAELDFGTRRLEDNELRYSTIHTVGTEYLSYHNEHVFGHLASTPNQIIQP